MTSSSLFSRKLEHIRANPKVSLSITDPVAVDGRTDRATIQGDARIIEDDPHGGWERLLPIWEQKEPSIVYFLKARVALPLFFERALIEITPRRVLYWSDGDAGERAGRDRRRRGGRVMRSTPEVDARTGLEKLATYPYQILTWVDDAGYPGQRRGRRADQPRGTPRRRFEAPAGLVVPTDREVSLTGSHIRPQPGYGYDERRHVTVWGPATITGATVSLEGRTAWGWDEAEVPFFEYSERSVGKSRKYFDALSAERGTPVKPSLSLGFLTLRTTRLPFLTATIVPVTLGILIAASHGQFDLVAALLTIIGACFVQLGLNVANDVFDTIQGADDANVTPDPVLRRLARHPVRAREPAPDGDALDGLLRPGRGHRADPARDPRLDGAAGHRRGRASSSASGTPRRRSSSSIAGSARSRSRSGSGR